MWRILPLTWISNLSRFKFDFNLNLTSAIGNLANRDILASYVSCHNVMAYDRDEDNDNIDDNPTLSAGHNNQPYEMGRKRRQQSGR